MPPATWGARGVGLDDDSATALHVRHLSTSSSPTRQAQHVVMPNNTWGHSGVLQPVVINQPGETDDALRSDVHELDAGQTTDQSGSREGENQVIPESIETRGLLVPALENVHQRQHIEDTLIFPGEIEIFDEDTQSVEEESRRWYR
jgi:hypothetical protein